MECPILVIVSTAASTAWVDVKTVHAIQGTSIGEKTVVSSREVVIPVRPSQEVPWIVVVLADVQQISATVHYGGNGRPSFKAV